MKEVITKAIEGGWRIGDGRWDGEKIHKVEIRKSQWMGYAKKWLFGGEFNPFAWKDIAIVKFKEEEVWVPLAETMLDPLFWQALGKALEWHKEPIGDFHRGTVWIFKWHQFIDALVEGQTPDQFFKELIK